MITKTIKITPELLEKIEKFRLNHEVPNLSFIQVVSLLLEKALQKSK